jgi:hypothetical protein
MPCHNGGAKLLCALPRRRSSSAICATTPYRFTSTARTIGANEALMSVADSATLSARASAASTTFDSSKASDDSVTSLRRIAASIPGAARAKPARGHVKAFGHDLFDHRHGFSARSRCRNRILLVFHLYFRPLT